MQPYRIRAAAAPDAERIAEVHVEAWRTAYRGLLPDSYLDQLDGAAWTRKWQDRLRAREAGTLVVEVGGLVEGFCSLVASRDHHGDSQLGEIPAIYINPGLWGRGLGRELLQTAIESAGERGYAALVLWVFEANAAARRFYERHGFALDGAQSSWTTPNGFSVPELRYRRLIR